MADATAPFETRQDGSVVLDPPVNLPEVLDAVIVGGGPFGTAAAFRLKELGRSALVVDYDDLMKRIRDYAKGKPILPDYGGGDRMQFPKGGDLVRRLQFPRIDKDEMCVQWKSFYREFGVPAQVGVEMTGLERDGDIWQVVAWNHNLKKEQIIKARHVVLAFGRGVPRRFDIPGNVAGLAFALTIANQYFGEPVLVIGGGTSAAEAVIAISGAKNSAGDPTDVYWSYRGEKMPKVSRALADEFFDAFVGNGNVRYLPTSEPVAVLEIGEESFLSVRTNRIVPPGCPPETTQLEFKKTHCIACIGEDIPELLLTNIGAPLVAGGAANKKRIVVSPLLETRQPNVYLAGAVLSPAYFETTEFDDPTTFKEIKRRDNIKAAMRDGVLVAEVIESEAGRQDADRSAARIRGWRSAGSGGGSTCGCASGNAGAAGRGAAGGSGARFARVDARRAGAGGRGSSPGRRGAASAAPIGARASAGRTCHGQGDAAHGACRLPAREHPALRRRSQRVRAQDGRPDHHRPAWRGHRLRGRSRALGHSRADHSVPGRLSRARRGQRRGRLPAAGRRPVIDGRARRDYPRGTPVARGRRRPGHTEPHSLRHVGSSCRPARSQDRNDDLRTAIA